MIMFVQLDEFFRKNFSSEYFLSEKFFLVSIQSQQKLSIQIILMKDINIFMRFIQIQTTSLIKKSSTIFQERKLTFDKSH